MSASIRVLYIAGSTAGSNPPLAAHDEFDVATIESITAGLDRLSVDLPDCIVVTPDAIAEADKSSIEQLWHTAPDCPCLLAPPPREPPVVGEEPSTAPVSGDDQPSATSAPTLAARIRTSVNTSSTATQSDTGAGESSAAGTDSIEAKAVKPTSIVDDRDELQTATETGSSAGTEPAYRSLIKDGLSISSVGTFVLDSDFSVVWLNDGIEDYFGVDRADVLGRDKRQLINNRLKYIFAEPERFAETVIDTYDDNTYVEQFACHVVGDDNRTDRWLEHSSYPIPDGPYAGGRIEHYVDITDHRETQQRLEAQNERLAEFASIASHDLRNPLHVMGSSLKLAEETGETEHFERAERAVDRMEQLIDDLLVLAKQGDGIDAVEPVDLDHIARECWGPLSTTEATLRVKTDHTIMADRSRLRQLLGNLFRNSVDHAGPAVTVTLGDCDGGFFVADNGPGVPADDRERIRERGYTTSREGTGLGLYIVSEIAAAHGWDMVVTDSKTGGVRVEFTGVD